VAGRLRVALLGCGTLAEILADRVYPQTAETVEVVAAVDLREDRARAIGSRLGSRAFTSLRDAAAAVELDAVDVRLPHHLHLEGARLAAEQALPFLIEKPMAPTLEEAREIAALAERVRGPCGVSENYGFLEPVVAARDLLRSGAIGELLAVQSTRVFELGAEWRRDGWRLAAGGPSGVLIDQAPHVARLLRTVVGEIAEVHAYVPAGAGPEDAAVVACRFESGQIGTQLYCWACPTPAAPEGIPELSLYGSEGSLSVYVRYTGTGGGALLQRPGNPDQWHGGGTNYYDSLARCLEDWATSVLSGDGPVCSIAEGLADTAVMSAIRGSAATGEPARVSREPLRS
jgi:predicted dehydrogenase